MTDEPKVEKPKREMVWHRGRQWFIAEAKMGFKTEFHAEERLRKQGYETIFPTKPDFWFLNVTQRRARKHRRRKKREYEGEIAVLGKHIFVGSAPGQSVRAIRDTVGIQDVMETASGEVYRVPAPAMALIERWLNGEEMSDKPQDTGLKIGDVYVLNELANQIHMTGMLAEIAKDADGTNVGEKIKVLIRFMGSRVEASIPADYLGERAELPRNDAGSRKSSRSPRAERV